MSSTLLEVPEEPLPTTHSATANVHRLSRVSADELVLEPGDARWRVALVSLGVLLLVVAVCLVSSAGVGITLGLSLVPFAAASGFAVNAWFYDRFGTRARFDRRLRSVAVTGRRHGEGLSYPWEGIKAVQFCESQEKFGARAWRYQVNLVVGSDPLWRINLLSSGGRKQLRRIAADIAEFLGVPLYVNALAAQDGSPQEHPEKTERTTDKP